MKTLLVIGFILLTFSIFSQEEKKFLVGAYFNPEASYRNLSVEDSDIQFIVDLRNRREISKFGFETGVSFEYRIKWYSSVEFGVGFADKGERTIINDFQFGDQPNNNDPGYDIRFVYHYYYLTLPLKFRFSFLKKNIRPFASLGVSTNIYLGSENEPLRYYPDGKKERGESEWYKQEGFNAVNFQGIVSVGCDFDFKPGITLRIEPTYRHSFHSISEKDFIQSYLFSLGCSLSVFYRF